MEKFWEYFCEYMSERYYYRKFKESYEHKFVNILWRNISRYS